MTEDESKRVESRGEANSGETNDRPVRWLDVLKAVAIPLVTLVLGFVFNNSLNTRQARESNIRLYTEMMGRREQADSDLRKDMFKSILDTFMRNNPNLKRDELLDQEVLNLELLADNFHESLDLAPLFKHVRRQIPEQEEGAYADMRKRLEKVAQEVVGRQLTIISDNGMVDSGETLLQNVDKLQAYLYFGVHYVPDPNVKPGEGVSRLCLSMMDTGDQERHYRQFRLEVTDYDPRWREVRVRLYASRVLDRAACESADLDLAGNREIDTKFWAGLFDFPMIDNTHLTHDERCAVSVTELTPYNLKVSLAYFPGSRASLKDKPYYDDLIHDLVSGQHSPGGGGH